MASCTLSGAPTLALPLPLLLTPTPTLTLTLTLALTLTRRAAVLLDEQEWRLRRAHWRLEAAALPVIPSLTLTLPLPLPLP